MKVTVDCKPLVKALALAKAVVPATSIAPIFESVLLEAEGESLSVSASDNEIGVRQSVIAQVGEPGAFALPARRIHAIIAELPGDTVALTSLPHQRMEVRAGSCAFVLPCLAGDEYPAMAIEKGEGGEFAAGAFADVLDRVSFAASTNLGRANMLGVYFLPTGTTLDVVATDGSRMARETLAERKMMALGFRVPLKGIEAICIALRQVSPEAICRFGLSNSGSVAQATIGPLIVTARLLEGDFPDYTVAINTVLAHQYTMRIARSTVLASVRRAMLLGCTGIRLGFAPDSLTVSATHNTATLTENATAEYAGPAMSMECSGQLAIDALMAIGGGDVVVHLGEGEPISFTSAALPGYVSLLAPYRARKE